MWQPVVATPSHPNKGGEPQTAVLPLWAHHCNAVMAALGWSPAIVSPVFVAGWFSVIDSVINCLPAQPMCPLQ